VPPADKPSNCASRYKPEDLGILLQWHWKYGTAAFTNERQRVQLSLLMLFSAFTGSRPDTLLGDDSLSKNSQETSIDDSSDSTLADNSDGDTLVDDESNAQNTKRLGTVCYGDIELFLLRNPDNPERDILMAEVNFRNLKGRAEGADW
jgi:Protein of unknown function (DUF3435)